MYRYYKRGRRFDAEMLEGQAEMVGDYHGLRNSTDPKLQTRRIDLRRRLKGTGIYGLYPLPIVVAATLAACGQGPTRVDVSGGPGKVHFTATAPEGGDRACIDTLSVTPVEAEDAAPFWQVSAIDPARCVSSLLYGEPTRDFAQTTPALPLREDVTYRVRLSGAGFSAVQDFRTTARGPEPMP